MTKVMFLLSSAPSPPKNLNAGTGWGQWGNFVVDDTVPTGSTVTYYAVTSTSTYNLTTNTAFLLTGR